ncbi:MAG: peroxidase family protein [Gammaproteobacteria bacterium]
MFVNISHSNGVENTEEILFSTPFGYLFPDAANSPKCLLPESESTVAALRALGKAMADDGSPSDEMPDQNSNIPAIFTYLGQFIDHDLTARTDRDGSVSELGFGVPPKPLDYDHILNNLKNGRRAQLDLDSVYGDGPGMAGSISSAHTQADVLYESDYSLKLFNTGGRLDLNREAETRTAIIADMRNDENLIVSQLHASIIAFHNKVAEKQSGSDKEKYIRARQLVRWAYQYVVINEYLNAVCDENVVADVLANGPRYLGSTAGRSSMIMPLEFSVAGFRFGHSMIRPFYTLNSTSGNKLIMDLLGTAGQASLFDGDGHLSSSAVIDWNNFAPRGNNIQMARTIDPLIARGLFQLPFEDRRDDPILANLAISNLLRAYTLRIPTGQAIAAAMRTIPLTPAELTDGEDPAIAQILRDSYFDRRTPLWYYVLREAVVQQGGQKLGEVGSRIVAETLISLVKNDPNSYINNRDDNAVRRNGVDVKPGFGGLINQMSDILEFAEVANL